MRYSEINEAKSRAIAYHGSPHKFDKFKFGAAKGTGNNGYGFGLYFTPSKDIADRYRQETAGDDGYIYTVELPPLDRFLRWDEPFGKQPLFVRKALRSIPDLTSEPKVCAEYVNSCIKDRDDGRLFFFSLNNFARNDLRVSDERKYVTELFAQAGIAGMIYDNDDDDINYVVFSPENIRIVSREP